MSTSPPVRSGVLAGFLVAVLFLVAGGVRGENAATGEADWRAALTTDPPGSFPMLPPSILRYKLSWNGVVKAGEATVTIRSTERAGQAQSPVEVSAETRSTGAARLLWPYEALNRCRILPSSLLPVSADLVEEDRREVNTYKNTFTNGLVHSEWVTEPKDPEATVENRVRTFEFDTIYDLVSSVLYLRSLPLRTEGDSITIVTFPFRDPYLVTVNLLGREKHKFDGEMVDALKFDVNISKILKDGSARPISNKLKSAHFWVSDDEMRLPLELRAEVFVGSIRVRLSDHELLNAVSQGAPQPNGAKSGWVSGAARKARAVLGRFK